MIGRLVPKIELKAVWVQSGKSNRAPASDAHRSSHQHKPVGWRCVENRVTHHGNRPPGNPSWPRLASSNPAREVARPHCPRSLHRTNCSLSGCSELYDLSSDHSKSSSNVRQSKCWQIVRAASVYKLSRGPAGSILADHRPPVVTSSEPAPEGMPSKERAANVPRLARARREHVLTFAPAF